MIAVLTNKAAINNAFGDFEVIPDVLRMRGEGGCHQSLSSRIKTRRVAEEIIAPNPIDRPDSHLHGAMPIHPMVRRVPVDPVMTLRNKFAHVFIVDCKPVCQSQWHKVITATQLPRNLDVGGVA